MTKKILFWLDPSMVDFCIAKALQDKKNYEKYAIIETNQGKNFYQNQKLVKFNKIWFFRDCFSDLNFTPDSNYLQKFEEKYKINLWQIVYADITFNQYNTYYSFSDNEILRILETQCKFFEKILDEVNPDYLIIKVTDMSYMVILQKMCQSKNIKVLTLGFTRLGIKSNISQEYDTIELSNKKFEKKELKSVEDIKKYVSEYSKQQGKFREKFRSSKLKWFTAGLEYLKTISNKKNRNYYISYGHTFYKTIVKEISFLIKKQLRYFFINRNLIKNVKLDEPFVYFPLQLEPERTILIPAPFYTNQKEVITNVAKSLPINYKLVVKEHPMQKVRGWRSLSYYKEIKEIPNVEFCHPEVPNEIIIKKCSLVITITGTSGLEAAINGKPSITFADTIYSELPSVFRVKELEKLPLIIREALESKVSTQDVIDYISKIEANSFDLDQIELSLKMCRSFYYDGFLFDVKISESKMKKFLEENKNIFENLAEKFDEKLSA